MSLAVQIQNDLDYHIPPISLFQSWINAVVDKIPEKINCNITEVCIRIIDEKESAYLNETYRHKKGPTNILSFSYPTEIESLSDSLGDLAICAELVISEAKKQGKSELSHWAHLTIHGMLHLLGYDHEKPDEAKIMEALEIQLLEQLNFVNPYLKQERIIDE